MAVHLTRIYTRTGDDGTTALGDMSRVVKTDPRVVAYADCDETNAAIGVALALGSPDPELGAVLLALQNDLFDVGADLCTPVDPEPRYPPLRVTDAYVERLEGWCDEYNARLSTLDSFILPGGTPLAALLHTARVVARRAERSAWELELSLRAAVPAGGDGGDNGSDGDVAQRVTPAALRYLNRLSDLLFILSRAANPDGDVLWRPGGARTT